MKQSILEKTLIKFLASGFNRVTTDEISADLGISKKTLYKYFETKDILVEAVVQHLMDSIREKVEAIVADSSMNAVQKLEKLFETISHYIFRISKQTLDDLQRSRPDLFQRVIEFRTYNLKKNLAVVLREGQQEGLIREDLDIQLAIDMFLLVINGIIIPGYLMNSPHTPKTALETIYNVVFYGILKK